MIIIHSVRDSFRWIPSFIWLWSRSEFFLDVSCQPKVDSLFSKKKAQHSLRGLTACCVHFLWLSASESMHSERRTACQPALDLLFTWMGLEMILCQTETGVRRVLKCPQYPQTSWCEWENSLLLGNSLKGRPVHVVLRRLQKGQTTLTGGDNVKVNNLTLAESVFAHRDVCGVPCWV